MHRLARSLIICQAPRMLLAQHTNHRDGLTIVEVMIVVILIGMLAAIAIPSLLRARNESQMKACIVNLKAIDTAKQLWAAETKAGTNTSPTAAVLAPYFQRRVMPVCPANGTYIILPVNYLPVCTFFNQGHKMPGSGGSILIMQ